MQSHYEEAYDEIMKYHFEIVGNLETGKRNVEGYLEQGYVLQHGKEFVPLPVFAVNEFVTGVHDVHMTRLSPSVYYVGGKRGSVMMGWEVNIDTGVLQRVIPRWIDFSNQWNGLPLIAEDDPEEIEGAMRVKVQHNRRGHADYYMNTKGVMVDSSDYILYNERRFRINVKFPFHTWTVCLLEEEGVEETKHMFFRGGQSGLFIGNREEEAYFLYRGEWYSGGGRVTHIASGKKMPLELIGRNTTFRVSDVSGNILVANHSRGTVTLLTPTEEMYAEAVDGPLEEGFAARY